MDLPTLEEWSSTISSMPNDKAPGPSMISYEMLKHLGPHASSLLLNLAASHNVLQGGNFAGLPGGSCRDPIITLESLSNPCGFYLKTFQRLLTLWILLC
ncbi:unnamed protein product [Rhizophagus irregularis]|nr:unnamed protein product [Rhizophagus irregularis]